MNEDLSAKWGAVLKKHPEANFLQSSEYGKMQELTGAKVVYDDFDGTGWMLAIVRDAKRGRYLEVPCGPLINWGDAAEVNQAFRRIREIGEREKCAFARVRPQLSASSENLHLLEGLGLKKSPMHLAAEHTVMIDLTKPTEVLMGEMRRQTRYEVRRAEKLGIRVVKSNTEEAFRKFYRVQGETAKRQGFIPPSLRVLLAEREAFRDKITIYQAVTEAGEAIAYGLIIGCGEEADYYEAASTELNRKLPGAYALLWQAIQDLKAAGYKRFNLWGIAPPNQPNHRYAGVTTFKTGFPGEVVEFVPAHDLIINRVAYLKDYVVETARKKRRHL